MVSMASACAAAAPLTDALNRASTSTPINPFEPITCGERRSTGAVVVRQTTRSGPTPCVAEKPMILTASNIPRPNAEALS